jgi:hypothetical protein
MRFQASGELAMILPLAVPAGSPEDAVEFVDLTGYPTLLEDLDRAFPAEFLVPSGRGGAVPAQSRAPRLAVQNVGAFEASFVPSPQDFERLDPRFRLPSEAWDQLPGYEDFGFAVFKLREPPRRGWTSRLFGSSGRAVHPMAFRFPRRDPTTLFFPTVHVHDGEVHAQADFDHSLFFQVEEGHTAVARVASLPSLHRFEVSPAQLRQHVAVERSQGLLDPTLSCLRDRLSGRRSNTDYVLDVRPESEGWRP